MNPSQDPRDTLTHRLLDVCESNPPRMLPGQHPEDEELALFCDGQLSGDRQQTTIAHLADCQDCRLVVASLLRTVEQETAGKPTSLFSHTGYASLVRANPRARRDCGSSTPGRFFVVLQSFSRSDGANCLCRRRTSTIGGQF